MHSAAEWAVDSQWDQQHSYPFGYRESKTVPQFHTKHKICLVYSYHSVCIQNKSRFLNVLLTDMFLTKVTEIQQGVVNTNYRQHNPSKAVGYVNNVTSLSPSITWNKQKQNWVVSNNSHCG